MIFLAFPYRRPLPKGQWAVAYVCTTNYHKLILMQATAERVMGGGFRRNSDSELKLKNRCTGSTLTLSFTSLFTRGQGKHGQFPFRCSILVCTIFHYPRTSKCKHMSHSSMPLTWICTMYMPNDVLHSPWGVQKLVFHLCIHLCVLKMGHISMLHRCLDTMEYEPPTIRNSKPFNLSQNWRGLYCSSFIEMPI